jgi:hypothetical protein
MTNNTLFCGLALAVIGIYSYYVDTPEWVKKANPIIESQNEEAKKADPNAPQKELKKASMTALIPAALGVVLLLVVVLVIYKPGVRKHAMHLAAVVGVVGVAGGLYALSGGPKEITELGLPMEFATMWDQPKIRSGALTALVSAVYVGVAVKSFIDARKAQAAAKPA